MKKRNMKNKKVIIVGAGLVGSLWGVYMSKAGYEVVIYEMRSDIRRADIKAGKSINLALSNRGWKALETVGVAEEIRKMAIPMYGRTMHDLDGELTFQAYGKEDEAIYSVSRGGINAKMMDIAEEYGDAKIIYNHTCIDVDLFAGQIKLKNTETDEIVEDEADLIFGADGAFSAVRYTSMQKVAGFNFSQEYVEDGYREILLPAYEDGSYRLAKNTLHIWPRGRFMLIALPNEDGSFTCTLFMPFKNHEYSFDKLNDKKSVENFFKEVFPDFYKLMPDISEHWSSHPLSSLALIKCYPWSYGKTVLIGDSAHATVPFYGQGMNCGFEDLTIMWEIMQKHEDNWELIFKEYEENRKANADAMQNLSLHNYHVMRDYVADPKFLLQKRIEAKFSKLYPDKWMPLYSQVTFSHIPYSEAAKVGFEQERIMKEVMQIDGIEEKWDLEDIMYLIKAKL